MTVRAHARRDLALIFRTACPKTEDHHHAVIEAEAPGAAVHPWQVIAGGDKRAPISMAGPEQGQATPDATPPYRSLDLRSPGNIVRPEPAAPNAGYPKSSADNAWQARVSAA